MGSISGRALSLTAASVALLLAAAGGGTPPALAAPFVVNSNADPGSGTCDVSECTLREAITAANAAADLDNIAFSIGSGAQTITVDGGLPSITQPVSIDGTTQPGYAGTPLIEISGANLATYGLRVLSGDSIIRGLVVNRFVTAGISLESSGNSVTNSFIGTDVTGAVDLGNGTGLVVGLLNNTIGGTTGTTANGACTGDCNVISGNGIGVNIGSGENSNNLVLGNFIGLDVTGTVDLGNSSHGVSIGPGSTGGSVGNGTAAGRNVISGNDGDGVRLIGGGSHTVQGNYIGTNSAGNADLGNTQRGLATSSSSAFNAIGGSSPGQGNLISGNDGSGIGIDTFTNTVWGNLVGTKADGLTALANTGAGITVGPNSGNNVIGGTDLGQGNTVAFNSAEGVRVERGYFANNKIRGNSIHSNALKGIEVVPGTGDIEPPIPVITVVGSASGTSCANCIVDVFSDSADEGRVYEGTTIADDNGDASGDWSYFGPVSGPNVTVTATDPGHATSEFSAAFACSDFDLDTVSNCSDSDDDNDGFTDEAEAGIVLCRNAENDDSFETETIYFVNDGCPAIGIPEVNCGGALDNDLDGFPNDGCPKDGLYSEAEFRIGTGSQDPCGNSGWPSDLVSSGVSRVDIVDLGSFVAGAGGRKLNTNPGETGFSSRWDLVPARIGTLKFINLADMAAMITGATGFPPMLNGAKALGGPDCPFAP